MSDNTFKSSDIFLGAYLLASEISKLVRIEQGEYPVWKKTFVFEPVPSEEERNDFYSGTATVSALRLCNEIRNLKSACQNFNSNQAERGAV